MKLIIVVFLIFMCIAARVADIYEELNTTRDEAKTFLLGSIGSGYMNVSSDIKMAARSLSISAQTEAVRELIHLAKEYSTSEQFKKDYKKWRNERIGGKKKFGIPNPKDLLDKALDKQLDKSKNDQLYPADPDQCIKKRLEDFMVISADVNFDAELTDSHMFVNPEYEKKSSAWKMCYRAGKAVVQAAREEAKKWLDEINK